VKKATNLKTAVHEKKRGRETKKLRQGELQLKKLKVESGERKTAQAMRSFEKQIGTLSIQELRELALVNTYKLSLARNQLDAVVDILIKNKLTTYEEVWKRTNERFQQMSDIDEE
jgi:ribosomal protein L11